MRKFSLWASILSAVGMIAAVALVLPDSVPIHFDLYGNADQWGSKWFYAFFALLPLIVALSLEIYRKKRPDSKNAKMEERIVPAISLMFIAFGWIFLPAAGQNQMDVRMMCGITLLLGLLMVYISNYSGKIQQNRHLGIRLPWTLADETVWKKTHRLGGFTGTIGGAIMAASSIVGMCNPDQSFAWCIGGLIAGILLLALPPTVYSIILYHKLK